MAAGKEPIDIVGFPSNTDAVLALKADRVDAVETDSPVAAYYVAQDPETFELGEAAIDPILVGIAINKDNTELRDQVQAAIDEMYADGDMPSRIETRRFDFRLPDSLLDTVPATLLASAPFPMAACDAERRAVSSRSRDRGLGQVREARILAAEPAGLFDATALAIARGSRLSPAYRDGQPIAATALLTLRFDPARATCPNLRNPTATRPPASVRRRA